MYIEQSASVLVITTGRKTMIVARFHNVFGLSAETVQSQPVLGWKEGEDIDEAQVYFFDGYVINIPFVKIMIGDIFEVFE